jgi:hypothetical protein
VRAPQPHNLRAAASQDLGVADIFGEADFDQSTVTG